MIAYPIDFTFNFETNAFTYADNQYQNPYGFAGYNEPQQVGYTYGAPPSYSILQDGSQTGLDGGRIAIRPSSYHDFARCDSAHVLSQFLGGQDLGMFPTPSTTTPIFSWFKVEKVPHQIVRRMLENYQAAVSGGVPRTFLLFTSLPFTDRVDALHFHGAEAQLSSRRVVLGQMRIVARATKLEQQATVVISNAVTDAIKFSFDIGFAQFLDIGIGNFPAVDFSGLFPFPAATQLSPATVVQEGEFENGGENGDEHTQS